MKKTKRKFSDAEKKAAVDEYLSGGKRAAEIAQSIGIAVGLLYKWRVMPAEAAKGERIDELEQAGNSPAQAERRNAQGSGLCSKCQRAHWSFGQWIMLAIHSLREEGLGRSPSQIFLAMKLRPLRSTFRSLAKPWVVCWTN